jgi:hypothetical protein
MIKGLNTTIVLAVCISVLVCPVRKLNTTIVLALCICVLVCPVRKLVNTASIITKPHKEML